MNGVFRRPVANSWQLAATMVAAIALFLYLPTLAFQFINWDDEGYVTANRALSYHWWEFFQWAFTTFQQGNWHPLTWISLKIDQSIWGLNPLGFHLTNVLLHAANSFLVVLLLWRLLVTEDRDAVVSGRPVLAFMAGLIFAVHPLHVESVAWVSERKDLLFAFFYLLSVITWTAWVKRPVDGKRAAYMASFLFFCLSLMSKPMAVSLPVVLVLLDIYPLRRASPGFRLILEKTPFIAVALISIMVTLLAQSKVQAVAPMLDLSLFDRLGNAARAFFFYVYKGIAPLDLSPLYQLRAVDTSLQVKGIFAGAGYFVLLALAVINFRKFPSYFVLLGSFTVMLLPVLGLVQVGSQFAADRYMYLPIIPLSVGVVLLIRKLGDRWRWRPAAYVPMVAAAGIAMMVLTYQQMQHWRNSEVLWNKVLAEDYEVPVAHYNLGNYYLSVKRPDLAEPEWLTTVQLDPGYSWAQNQLGNLHLMRGELGAALDRYEKAVSGKQENVQANFNYAQLLDHLGRFAEAREAYARFLATAAPEYQEQADVASLRIQQIDTLVDR